VAKNGFEGVVLGLSGGIDSALVAAVATEALGPERVTCLVMPSPHSSAETQGDAREMTRRLGVRLLDLAIERAMTAYHDILADGGVEAEGVTAENLQARIRGNLVMAVSNREGALALSCGNKSEAAVGYATLYGDMAGGLAPIKDLYKTWVYGLARHLNETGLTLPDATRIPEPIPPTVIERAPSAELRPGQADTDSLPPYDLLDQALEAHIERDLGRAEMLAEGIDPEVADRVIHLVRISEHKRRQSAPGIRVTPKSLDRDRRVPITNGYRAR
jgi:NAD+ synthase (glutamine-hydrolysing)